MSGAHGAHFGAIEIVSFAMVQSIAGQRAPDPTVPYSIDSEGKERPPLTLWELGARHRLLFFCQRRCSGCHSHEVTTLHALVKNPHTKNVGFAAVQTAFEGVYVNTRDRLLDLDPEGVVLQDSFTIDADEFICALRASGQAIP
jgi:hypothetical protein